MKSFCEFRGVRKNYGHQCVLDVEHLDIEAGRITSLVGANGSGKTTLLELAALLSRPCEGTVRIWGQEAKPKDYHLRQTIVMVMHPGLLFRGTVWSNIMYGLRATGTNRAESRQRAAQALQTVGMAEFADRDPSSLSAGERQRVNLARAVALEPRALLLDEPTANVDAECVRFISRLLPELRDRDETTIIHTSPTLNGLEGISDRQIRLENSRIVE